MLGKNQKLAIEALVKKIMGVAYMPEDLTGYNPPIPGEISIQIILR